MNTRIATACAFALGLAAVVWVGWGFVGSNPLALVMTALIAGGYLLGAHELRQYRAATRGLAQSLDTLSAPPAELGAWLQPMDASLRAPVRQRIEGLAAPLPGPALTPYLVGLLVMLGMLGTFLGMVVTFKGAVFALEGSADLTAIRAALAEPIKGLSLSFGTSVAGVAASAMLGLMSSLARRERLTVSRQLDVAVATVLRPLSAAHQREQTVQALQAQAQALPLIAERLQAWMAEQDARTERLQQQLVSQQQTFQQEAAAAYTELARTVGASLQETLRQGVQQAAQAIEPVVVQTMDSLGRDAQQLHERVVATTQAQWQTLLSDWRQAASQSQDQQAQADAARLLQWQHSLAETTQRLADEWQRAGAHSVAQQQAVTEALSRTAQAVAEQAGQRAHETLQASQQLVAQAEALVRSRMASETQWQDAQRQRMDELATVWRQELTALREQEAARADTAIARLDALQASAAQHLASLGASLETPITRLLQTAADVPQAAAEVIAQLRQEMTRLGERDTQALAERAALTERLAGLLDILQATTAQQREAVNQLVQSAGQVFEQTAAQLSDSLAAQTGQVDEVATRVAASAVELASLGEAFQHGVGQFSASNDKLADSLQRVEAAIAQSLARSDEQLAYYVAQAREVIDLSISAQQGIVEDLRRLKQQPAVALGGA
ncbi:hypothetical protein GTZ97_16050 [Aquabacterium fontiphilum]|jgi:hypothetical protein|uniref:hypothetical protein n=1 Tax=Aquabacterium fontiphilum TaxID=450365 RepID=UPI0013775E61|nr:hypothetical protein [Aquabacterium fontiphilum]NBD22173.1 hypothetical protein [Aquabacterium fontiphilum]